MISVPSLHGQPVNPGLDHYKVSRRQFLGASLALAAAMELRGALAEEQPPKIKAGFLGTGHSHFTAKYKLLQSSPDFELVGLCEDKGDSRDTAPSDARWLGKEQFFREVDMVVVESPVKDHSRHATLALEAGKHVHLEKPPADSMKAFQEIARLTAQNQRVLQVGYMWRYHPGVNAVLEAARAGWLGEVVLVRGTINTLIDPAQRKTWAPFPGGAMFEQGGHLIDPLVRLLGKPTKVTPFLKNFGLFADGLQDNTVAVFEFKNRLGIITSSPLQPNAGAHRFFEVVGTNGMARVEPLEPPGLVIDLGRDAGAYHAGRQEVKLARYERYVDEFAALARAIRGVRPLAVSMEEEMNVQETLLRACEMI